MIKEGQVVIVDEFTGRLMPGRRWSDGLHQAIEAKEGVEIKSERDSVKFSPYMIVKDALAMCVFGVIISAVIFLSLIHI